MKSDQEQIKKGIDGVAKELKGEKGDQFKAALDRVAKEGATPKNMLGLSDQMVEGIYGQAYRLYNTGRFYDAAELFRLLIMINAVEPKYILGLAASLHLMKDYPNAIQNYTVCSIMDPKNPLPLYHASDCYIQINDSISALLVLQQAIDRAGDKPEYQIIKDRAKMTVESLEKELGEAAKIRKKKE